MEPERRTGVHPPVRRLNPTLIALLGGVVILLLLIAYFATNRNSEQDKLTGKPLKQAQTVPEKRCASQATYDLIKRELLRRAAQLRGSDQAAYDRLSAYAVLRMENPVMDSESKDSGAVNCSGSLALDLPPGVAAVGGRRTLMSDVDYTVQPAADATGDVVLLRNADAVIAPLATLARTGQQAQPPTAPPTSPVAPVQPQSSQAPTQPPTLQPAPPRPAPAPPSQPPARPSATTARPSFNCANARTRGEIAVCSDSGLAALDRNMANEYRRAFAAATPDQRELLRGTARRFYTYRDRCPDGRCIGGAYAGRMREIRDIMEGRWREPR